MTTAFDPKRNFAIGIVSRDDGGDTGSVFLYMDDADSFDRFPDPDTDGHFNIVVWPQGDIPRDTNCEIMRVVGRYVPEYFQVTRAEEGTTALSWDAGFNIALTDTLKSWLDIWNAIGTLESDVIHKFADDISGDDSTTVFEVEHDLGTSDIVISLYRSDTMELVLCDVVVTDDNNVTFTFAVAPATAENYRVVIVG